MDRVNELGNLRVQGSPAANGISIVVLAAPLKIPNLILRVPEGPTRACIHEGAVGEGKANKKGKNVRKDHHDQWGEMGGNGLMKEIG